MEYELFHGADAQSMLFNLSRNGLTADSHGNLYFSRYEWQNCLVHGADGQTGESYVVRLRINIPADARIEREPRAGNRDALIICTTPYRILQCEFLELFVRRGNREEGFEVERIPGPAIEAYFVSCYG